jgi:hypothetical protein
MSGSRRAAIPLAAVVLTLSVSGCSPQDLSAIRSSPSGLPQVENCGGHIRTLDVSDAESGRPIWSIAAAENARPVGTVEVGLPPTGWRQDEPFDPEPLPEVWRLDLETAAGRTAIDVADADLQRDAVVFEDGSTESFESFKESTCPPIPESTRILLRNAMFGGIAVVCLAGGSSLLIARRRRIDAAP